MQPGSPRDADLTDNVPGSLGYLSDSSLGLPEQRPPGLRIQSVDFSTCLHRHADNTFYPREVTQQEKNIGQ